MRKIIPLFSLLIVLSLSGCSRLQPKSAPVKSGSHTAEPNAPAARFPARTGLVNDFALVLNADEKEQLDAKLRDFNNRARVEFAVTTVSSTGNEPIFDYSLGMAREWALGQAHSDQAGMLMVVAVDDRKWHIQISRVMEKMLSNEEVGRLGELMNADFKEQKYGAGMIKSVDAIIKTVSERRKK